MPIARSRARAPLHEPGREHPGSRRLPGSRPAGRSGQFDPVYISPQIEDLLGYPRAAWLNEDELWLDVLHPDDRERMVAADTEARRTLSSLFAEYRMIPRDGHVVWVSEKAAVVRTSRPARATGRG